jgi:hypothetical protein
VLALCQHDARHHRRSYWQEDGMSIEFKTESVFDALRSPLGLVEDPERRQAFERYVEAARYPLERAVFDLLSQLVTAADEKVSDRYHLRLSYLPGALMLDVEPVQAAADDAPADDLPDWSVADGETEKITIRIPAELKDLATQAAAAAGVSANSWFVRAMARSLRAMEERPEAPRPPWPPQPPRPASPGKQGKKLQGWYGGE